MQHRTKRRWVGRATLFIGAFLAMVLGLAAALFTGPAPIDGGVESSKVRTSVDVVRQQCERAARLDQV